LRPCIWNKPEVAWWYAQNALLFVREDRLASNLRLADAARATDRKRLSVVHPHKYLEAVEFVNFLYAKPDPNRLSLSTLLGVLPRVALNALRSRVGLRKR
jgi:hypothetical protein